MISNHLIKVLKRSSLSGLQFQVLMSVKSHTLQYRKAFAQMTSTYIANDIGDVNPVSIRRALLDLFRRKILLKTKNGIGFNPELNLWITGKLSKGVYQNGYTHCNNTDTTNVTIQLHNKRNKEKLNNSLSIEGCEQNNFDSNETPEIEDLILTKALHDELKAEYPNKDTLNELKAFNLYNQSKGRSYHSKEHAFKKWMLDARPSKAANKPRFDSKAQSNETRVNTHIQPDNRSMASLEDRAIQYNKPVSQEELQRLRDYVDRKANEYKR